MADRLITTQELCAILKVSRATVDRWRKAGLPFIKVGNQIRFREDEALKWVEDWSNNK